MIGDKNDMNTLTQTKTLLCLQNADTPKLATATNYNNLSIMLSSIFEKHKICLDRTKSLLIVN